MECALMGRRFHRGFTAAEKTELWDRWKRGESLKAIGRAFGKPSSSIYFLVAPHDGIRPAQRRRSRLALTLAEYEISRRWLASLLYPLERMNRSRHAFTKADAALATNIYFTDCFTAVAIVHDLHVAKFNTLFPKAVLRRLLSVGGNCLTDRSSLRCGGLR